MPINSVFSASSARRWIAAWRMWDPGCSPWRWIWAVACSGSPSLRSWEMRKLTVVVLWAIYRTFFPIWGSKIHREPSMSLSSLDVDPIFIHDAGWPQDSHYMRFKAGFFRGCWAMGDGVIMETCWCCEKQGDLRPDLKPWRCRTVTWPSSPGPTCVWRHGLAWWLQGARVLESGGGRTATKIRRSPGRSPSLSKAASLGASWFQSRARDQASAERGGLKGEKVPVCHCCLMVQGNPRKAVNESTGHKLCQCLQVLRLQGQLAFAAGSNMALSPKKREFIRGIQRQWDVTSHANMVLRRSWHKDDHWLLAPKV